jgi:uncharacterized membrane protein
VKEEKSFALGRTETFSDGVLAVIIAIMALELKVPEVVGNFQPHLLTHLVPRLASYAIAFFVVGVSWVQHVLALRDVPRATLKLFWLNLLFLFCASLIPFATAFLGEHPSLPIAVAMWGTVAAMTVFTEHLLYAAAHAGRPYENWTTHRNVFSLLAALAGIGMAFASIYVAWLLLLTGVVVMIIPIPFVRSIFSRTPHRVGESIERAGDEHVARRRDPSDATWPVPSASARKATAKARRGRR